MEDTQFLANLNIKKRKNTSYDVLSFWKSEQYRYPQFHPAAAWLAKGWQRQQRRYARVYKGASLCKRDLLGKGAAVRNAKPLFRMKKRQAKKTCRDVAPQVVQRVAR